MYRVVRVQHQGEVYHPVINDAGLIMDAEQLERLARTPSPQACRRKVQCILADESPLRDGRAGLRLQCLRLTQESLALHFQDSGLTIGTLMDGAIYRPGTIAGTQGRVFIGTAHLHETMLADIAWRALVNRMFGGVCLVVGEEQRDSRGRFQSGVLHYTILGHLEGSCIATARVLKVWEEKKSQEAV